MVVTSLVFFLIAILACHRKTIPAVTDRGVQPVAPATPVTPPPPPEPVIPAADLAAGKIIYETKCIRCHAAKPVEAYTADRWVGILRSMVPKARLDSIQTAQLTLYVNANAKKS